MKTNAFHFFEYLLVRVVVSILSRIPASIAYTFGRMLGRFAWCGLKIRREMVLSNMRRAFPEKSEKELEEMGRESYCRIGVCFIEMFRIHRMSTEQMDRVVFFDGVDIMHKAVEEGKGVVNVTFHYGNWELEGAYGGRKGLPLEVIVRKQQNPYFDRYVNDLRRANGLGLIPTSIAKKEVIRQLRKGRIVTFAADQDAHNVGVFVNFLGKPASTPKGPALYAFKTGAPVVLSIIIPQEDGRSRIVFESIPLPQTEDRDEFVYQLTSCYTARLEDYVRQAPENWFWPHRRWKTPPPGTSNCN